MSTCACGAPAELGNVDLATVQCHECWRAWSAWADANPDRYYTDWPGRG